MDMLSTEEILKKMLKEQLYCLGRCFARHQVPDDVIWEVAKGFDLIYMKILRQVEDSINSSKSNTDIHKMKPHPGIMYLLNKIDKFSL